MRVETIQTTSEFEALRAEWNELLQASDSDCLFLSWEWLFTWWRYLGDGKRLCILAARDGDRLEGIMPLARRGPQPLRLAPYGALEFLGAGTAGSDYLDAFVRRDAEEPAVEALAEALSARGEALELSQLRQPPTATERVAGRLAAEGWAAGQRAINVCPYIPLDGSDFEGYLAGLGGSHRANFNRRARALPRKFSMTFERACTEEQRERLLRALLDLHQLRWQSRGGKSDAFHTPGHVAFHQEFTKLALERGWLRLFLLSLDGRPAAALYGLRYGGSFLFFQSGFDPEFSAHSVGLVMMGMAIRSAMEEGASEYDMLHGNEPYKSLWARQARPIFRLEMFPPGMRGAMLRGAAGTGKAVRRMARRVLGHGGAVKLETVEADGHGECNVARPH